MKNPAPVYYKILAFVALFFLGHAGLASACTCAHQELETAVRSADSIFIGTILSRQDTPPDSRGMFSSGDPTYFEVEVERTLKGELSSSVTVSTVRSDVSCGYPFKQGTRYIIFGYRPRSEQAEKKGAIGTSLCTLTTAKNVDSLADQVDAILTGRPAIPSEAPNDSQY